MVSTFGDQHQNGPGRPHISSETLGAARGCPQVAARRRARPVWNSGQGALAQLGERLICIQEVRSSILLGSTMDLVTLSADDH